MINFLEETEEVLKSNGHTFEDVKWIGMKSAMFPTEECTISIDLFKKYADFNYDDGYGGVNINMDLVVVGDHWYLERHEYDGSEWWEYKEVPSEPVKVTTRNILKYNWWEEE